MSDGFINANGIRMNVDGLKNQLSKVNRDE